MKMIYIKILSACLVLSLLLCSCNSSIYEEATTYEATTDDVTAILEIVSKEVTVYRFSPGAENGRVIVLDVSAYEEDSTRDFVKWAEDEFNKSPDVCVVVTDSNKADLTDTAILQQFGDQITDQMRSEWSTFIFETPKYESGANTKATVSVKIQYVIAAEGYEVSLEKQNGTWSKTNIEMTMEA